MNIGGRSGRGAGPDARDRRSALPADNGTPGLARADADRLVAIEDDAIVRRSGRGFERNRRATVWFMQILHVEQWLGRVCVYNASTLRERNAYHRTLANHCRRIAVATVETSLESRRAVSSAGRPVRAAH